MNILAVNRVFAIVFPGAWRGRTAKPRSFASICPAGHLPVRKEIAPPGVATALLPTPLRLRASLPSRFLQLGIAKAVIAAALLDPAQAAELIGVLVGVVLFQTGVHARLGR